LDPLNPNPPALFQTSWWGSHIPPISAAKGCCRTETTRRAQNAWIPGSIRRLLPF